jgi:hypothetical protein
VQRACNESKEVQEPSTRVALVFSPSPIPPQFAFRRGVCWDSCHPLVGGTTTNIFRARTARETLCRGTRRQRALAATKRRFSRENRTRIEKNVVSAPGILIGSELAARFPPQGESTVAPSCQESPLSRGQQVRRVSRIRLIVSESPGANGSRNAREFAVARRELLAPGYSCTTLTI